MTRELGSFQRSALGAFIWSRTKTARGFSPPPGNCPDIDGFDIPDDVDVTVDIDGCDFVFNDYILIGGADGFIARHVRTTGQMAGHYEPQLRRPLGANLCYLDSPYSLGSVKGTCGRRFNAGTVNVETLVWLTIPPNPPPNIEGPNTIAFLLASYNDRPDYNLCGHIFPYGLGVADVINNPTTFGGQRFVSPSAQTISFSIAGGSGEVAQPVAPFPWFSVFNWVWQPGTVTVTLAHPWNGSRARGPRAADGHR